ncbi:MAG: hypothetical protein J6Q56_04195 [Clostridia bacterium]|nr:hypothetical protein [Clostridia bacterium]
MSAEEKILEGIISDAVAQGDEIIARAKAQSELVLTKAKDETKAYSAEVVSSALIKAKTIKDNAESAAALVVRDGKLAKKREEILKTVELAKKHIASLDDEVYFKKLVSIVKGYAKSEEGVLLLGGVDLKRNTALLETALKKANINVKISDKRADISGGFILKYGSIEYNLSVDAIIDEKKELLEDKINTILFSQK